MSALPLPPGRSGLPLLGEVLAFARDPYDFYESRFRAHGPVFRTKFFRDPVVCLQGHEALVP